MESALYGVYALVVLYQKSHTLASLTCSISDTSQLVCKHRTRALFHEVFYIYSPKEWYLLLLLLVKHCFSMAFRGKYQRLQKRQTKTWKYHFKVIAFIHVSYIGLPCAVAPTATIYISILSRNILKQNTDYKKEKSSGTFDCIFSDFINNFSYRLEGAAPV